MLMRSKNAKHIDFDGLTFGKLCPSDIDMVLERKGRFLFGEWKREGEKVSEGQKIMLKALARLPYHTVLIIEGNTDNEMIVSEFWEVTGDTLTKRGSSVQDLRAYIESWLAY